MRWIYLIAAAVEISIVSSAPAADWITAPSYFTHDWSSGHRVAQYSPVGPFYYYARHDYQKSGYRQLRSTLDLGNSSDNMHIVEQWGAPVIPYDQWRFPYRPFSVPYQDWGPPFGGLGGGTGMFPYSGGGTNFFPGFFPPWWLGSGNTGFGQGGSSFSQGGSGFGALSAPGGVGPGSIPGPGPGGPGHGHGNGRFPGTFFPPAVNFAQPWLDGHYPSYDLNDRSDYWRPYTTRPGRP
jgi:hypothetical protein